MGSEMCIRDRFFTQFATLLCVADRTPLVGEVHSLLSEWPRDSKEDQVSYYCHAMDYNFDQRLAYRKNTLAKRDDDFGCGDYELLYRKTTGTSTRDQKYRTFA